MEDTVVMSLNRECHPLHSLRYSEDISDFLVLNEKLQDVKIIGIGEATHGTSEFFQIRHRMLHYLVVEMQFTVLALEAGFSACEAINDYIIKGVGDPKEVVFGLKAAMYQTKEFLAVVEWLAQYNRTVAPDKKVRLYGLDICPNDLGREKVIDYFRRCAPDRLSNVESVFVRFSEEEEKWPSQVSDRQSELATVSLMEPIQELLDYLEKKRVSLIEMSSGAELDQMLQYLRLMKQWLVTVRTDLIPSYLPITPASKNIVRSRFHAENLIYIYEELEPNRKIIIWEHNYHIATDTVFRDGSIFPNLGRDLRARFSSGYYALGLEFYEGEYLSRYWEVDRSVSQFNIAVCPPAPDGSLASVMSKCVHQNFILDIRSIKKSFDLSEWLDSAMLLHCIGWVQGHDPDLHFVKTSIKEHFDGILFIRDTTATCSLEKFPHAY